MLSLASGFHPCNISFDVSLGPLTQRNLRCSWIVFLGNNILLYSSRLLLGPFNHWDPGSSWILLLLLYQTHF